MNFKKYARTMLAAGSLSLLAISSTGFASGIPDDLEEFFRKKPAVSQKNQGQQVPEAYDIAAALREDHVQKLVSQSKDELDALENLQIVLIIDHSYSQRNFDKDPEDESSDRYSSKAGLLYPNHWTQWDNTYKAAKYLSEAIFRFDKDHQVPVYFFSAGVHKEIAEDTIDLYRMFSKHKPDTNTNLYAALSKAFADKFAQPVTDPNERTLFVVLTDGVPNEGQEPMVKSLIHDQVVARDPEGKHLNVLFLRVGDDKNAKRFLRRLDRSPEVGNNVDTKPDNMIYAMGPENLFLNAIFEHLDKKGLYAEERDDDDDAFEDQLTAPKKPVGKKKGFFSKLAKIFK